jgi:hypothetical protein
VTTATSTARFVHVVLARTAATATPATTRFLTRVVPAHPVTALARSTTTTRSCSHAAPTRCFARATPTTTSFLERHVLFHVCAFPSVALHATALAAVSFDCVTRALLLFLRRFLA